MVIVPDRMTFSFFSVQRVQGNSTDPAQAGCMHETGGAFCLSASGAIPKCRYAAVRLECFFVDGCVDISSPSSSAFNSARHAGGSQRHSVFRSLAIASRV